MIRNDNGQRQDNRANFVWCILLERDVLSNENNLDPQAQKYTICKQTTSPLLLVRTMTLPVPSNRSHPPLEKVARHH